MECYLKSGWLKAAFVGALIGHPQAATAASTTHWCEWMRSEPARIVDDPQHPWLQSLQFEGKFQYQVGLIQGRDADGADFEETYEKYRRLRFGLKSRFLEVMELKATVNLVDDQRADGGDLDWGFAGLHEALLGIEIGKALGCGPFDAIRIDYGRHKFVTGQETHASSSHLLTIERSAIAKKIYESARPTGLSMTAAKDRWTFVGSLFSSTKDGEENESFSGWQDDLVWLAGVTCRVDDHLSLGVDLAWNHADAETEDSFLSYRWASSLHGEYDAGEWGVRAEFIVGDNGGAAMHADTDPPTLSADSC